MRTFTRSSELACDADAAWAAVKLGETFRYVTWPIVGVAGELPETLDAGQSATLRPRLLYFIPASPHTLLLESVDDERRTLQTREHGGPLRSWDHTIVVEPLSPGRCRYTDTVVLDAGRASGIARAIGKAFFRYRHARWRRLATRL